jgi:hypothetical protein
MYEDQLGRIWKEAVLVAYSRYYTDTYQVVLSKTLERPHRVAGVSVEIRSKHLPNTNLKTLPQQKPVWCFLLFVFEWRWSN